MIDIASTDWSLLIGYLLEDAESYLEEEGVDYNTIQTASPKRYLQTNTPDLDTELRVIGVRRNSPKKTVSLICARTDWSVS